MNEPTPFLIVGGGPVGLIAAKLLRLQARSFLGLEKGDLLGGKMTTLPTRLFSSESVAFLHRLMPELEWKLTQGTPVERIKGEWKEVREVSSIERPFLNSPFYSPARAWVGKLAEEVADSFSLHSHVVEIFPDDKKVVCAEGKEIHYEKLLWCGDIEGLRKAWKGDPASLLKLLKGLPDAMVAFDLELELSTPLRQEEGAIVFPFRYKEKKMRALGVSQPHVDSSIHWLVSLDEEISDDREEVAKCVRALKRELGKEFAELKENIKAERILFYPSMEAAEPREVKSLATLPDVFYLGSQLRREESEKDLIYFDVALDNCRYFEQSLKG